MLIGRGRVGRGTDQRDVLLCLCRQDVTELAVHILLGLHDVDQLGALVGIPTESSALGLDDRQVVAAGGVLLGNLQFRRGRSLPLKLRGQRLRCSTLLVGVWREKLDGTSGRQHSRQWHEGLLRHLGHMPPCVCPATR